MATDVVISYQRSDREFAAMLAKQLEDSGLSVWYDAQILLGAPAVAPTDSPSGQPSAVEDARLVVLAVSRATSESQGMLRDIRAADQRSIPVVAVLLDEARPRGAYLYELPGRNCVVAYPDPATRMGDVAALVIDCLKSLSPNAGMTDPADPLPDRTDAPRVASAYVGKIHQQTAVKPSRDILPFRLADLAVLVPGVALVVWWMLAGPGAGTSPTQDAARYLAAGFVAFGLIVLYAALVFPVRAYMRHRAPGSALASYALSSVILYALLIAIFAAGRGAGAFASVASVIGAAVGVGAVWLVFAAIAFVIYTWLSGRRAARMFDHNRKIL